MEVQGLRSLEKGDRAGKAKGKGTDPSASSSATSGEADVVIELLNMTVQLQEIGDELTVEQLDRVYEKCRLTAQGRQTPDDGR